MEQTKLHGNERDVVLIEPGKCGMDSLVREIIDNGICSLGAFLPIAIIAGTSTFSDYGISVWIY
ncbi:MAG: hypothetical protein WA364_02900 [Candidatus Nitrosopolaris sp.]